MINVAVSGAIGRLGSAIAGGITQADDLRLSGMYAPGHDGEKYANIEVCSETDDISAQVIVECAHADVVMGNLKTWHSKSLHVVVGTSGFTKDRLAELGSFWDSENQGCLVVPNFSIS